MLLGSLVALSAYLVIDGRWYGVDPSEGMVYDPATRSLLVDSASARTCASVATLPALPGQQALFYGPQLVQLALAGELTIVRKRQYLAVHMHSTAGDMRCDGEKSGEPIFRGHFEA